MESTTKLFAEVQAAYEVLSDPQERAWYDSHRDAILRNEDPKGEEHYEHNVRLTTVEDIVSMILNLDGKPDFSDSLTGFYSSLSEAFAALAREETLACEWEGADHVKYPSFGSSKDIYDGTVKKFYAAWSGFATRKNFSWKDVFRYSEAPDRRVRRMMEKENKRLREEGIKEFNDAVRALIAFVKKQDPRYTPNKQSDSERQKSLRDKAAAQAARSRAANEAKLIQETLPDWAKFSTPAEPLDGGSDHREDLEPEEQFECVVCKKNFKSEKQWETHEKSKKHLKAVQHIRRTMQREDDALGLDSTQQHSEMATRTPSEAGDERTEEASLTTVLPSADGSPVNMPKPRNLPSQQDGIDASNEDITSLESNDEYAPREEIEDRTEGQTAVKATVYSEDTHTSASPEDLAQALDSTSIQEKSGANKTPKIGKAKVKRAKKAAQKVTNTSDGPPEYNCTSCQASFPSKTRLFTHIKDSGHATPLPKATVKRGKN